MGYWGMHGSPWSFWKSVHSAAVSSLTVKISKIAKEEHILHFRLSLQKYAKTHVNRVKQSWNQKQSRARKDRKTSSCAPLTSFSGDATAITYTVRMEYQQGLLNCCLSFKQHVVAITGQRGTGMATRSHKSKLRRQSHEKLGTQWLFLYLSV